MKQRSIIVVGVALALLTGVPVHGRHSGSINLFAATTSTLKGSVAKWVWCETTRNVPPALRLDPEKADGQVVSWLVELQAPNTIYPAGYRINTFQARRPGDGRDNAVSDGRPYARVVSVIPRRRRKRTPGDGCSAPTRPRPNVPVDR